MNEERRRQLHDRRRKHESDIDAGSFLLGERLANITHTLGELRMDLAGLKAIAQDTADRVTNLQSVVDTEQDQIALALKKLQDIIDGGGQDPALMQEIADILTSANTNLQAVTTDVAGSIPDVPVP